MTVVPHQQRFFRFIINFENFKQSMLFSATVRYKVKSKMGETMFKYAGATDWKFLSIYLREITSINIFKQTLFTYLFSNDVNSHVCSL